MEFLVTHLLLPLCCFVSMSNVRSCQSQDAPSLIAKDNAQGTYFSVANGQSASMLGIVFFLWILSFPSICGEIDVGAVSLIKILVSSEEESFRLEKGYQKCDVFEPERTARYVQCKCPTFYRKYYWAQFFKQKNMLEIKAATKKNYL